MLSKAHLTSHSRMSGSRSVITHRDYLGREDLFCAVLLCILATSNLVRMFYIEINGCSVNNHTHFKKTPTSVLMERE